jgi:3-hydroxyacyl-[acyl-carrier-protein] dehydratase
MEIDISIIQKILPHRYPFLLIDRVTDLVPGESITGIKNVSVAEPYFQGHFPGRPIVPGVLIIESLAQLTAVMYCSSCFPEGWQEKGFDENIDFGDIAGKVGYLAEVKSFKFKSLVTPGDVMTLRAVKKVQFANLSQIKVSACVGNKTVAEGIITVSQND